MPEVEQDLSIGQVAERTGLSVHTLEVERVTGIEPALSAWESPTDLAALSWGNGMQVRAGRVTMRPR
ncbi:hypothetical protein [Streptosporangium roseum]|uniref:hypothetical protein n=1 Tax=Streptosporangium roseum TaxID=2001 RepID=UPI0011D18DDD|nr:hypothetical protein [Streptosporangium roseum]